MFRNYLTVGLRNLNKSRFYTLINIIGLTVGITSCLVILLFIRFELSYDTFNVNANRIFRVDWEIFFGGTHIYRAAATPPMAETFVRDYPEVVAAARFRDFGSFQFKRVIDNIVERDVVYADNDLFKIFTIPFVAGNPPDALKEPNSMVITERCAIKFFGNENALGKTLIKDNKTVYTITGIVKDLPDNSHFHFNMFLSMEGLEESKNGNWIGGPYNTYLLLRDGSDAKGLEAKLPGMVEKYLVPQAASVLGSVFMDDFKKGGNSLVLHLRPLLNIHLHSNLQNELQGNSDIYYVYVLGAIAIFILILACINFMNLATARSVKRAREVGIRKVMGSSRMNLAIQFVSESTFLSIVSFVLALGFTYLSLPIFNVITGMNLTVPADDWSLNIAVSAAAILLGIIAGIYPGLVLSAFQPAQVLKGKLTTGHEAAVMRSSLVVFQFAISTALIMATMALYQQISFIQSRKLGFSKEQVILLSNVRNKGEQVYAIRDEIVKSNLIKGGTISPYFPGPGSARSAPLMWQFGSTPTPDNSTTAEKWIVDYDYIPTLGMEIVAGRNFSRDFPSDSMAVILNQAAIRKLGLPENPTGQKISLFKDNPDGSQDKSKLETWSIVGVVKDFNFESLRENIAPLGLFFGTADRSSIAFRYETDNTQAVIKTLEQTWKKMAPGEPFNYSFLDQQFERMYSSEDKLSKIFVVFSGLAIIIACLGLFALTAFTAEQRTKEIGIRKTMGATSQNIVFLLSKKFSTLILIGFAIGMPLAAYFIYWFLQQYAYRTEISPWMYVYAGLMTFLLAFFTMGYQSVKAANTDPVKALRSE